MTGGEPVIWLAVSRAPAGTGGRGCRPQYPPLRLPAGSAARPAGRLGRSAQASASTVARAAPRPCMPLKLPARPSPRHVQASAGSRPDLLPGAEHVPICCPGQNLVAGPLSLLALYARCAQPPPLAVIIIISSSLSYHHHHRRHPPHYPSQYRYHRDGGGGEEVDGAAAHIRRPLQIPCCAVHGAWHNKGPLPAALWR